jgi:hypothetical protein
MQALYGRPVFSVDGDTFFWEDVVLDAMRRGRWTRLEREVREGLACVAEAEAAEDVPEEEIEEAAQEFRYARDLVTGQEMEDWLEARSLSAREWMGYMGRTVLRERGASRLGEILQRHPPDPGAVEAALTVDLICSGLGAELANQLAELASAAAAAGSEPATDELAARTPRRTTPLLIPTGLPPERAGERLAVLIRLDRGMEQFRLAAVTPEAVQREIGHRHTEWIRIDCRTIRFADAARAREAALCLREDGLSLDEVAGAARTSVAESRFYLDELEPDARPMFLAARQVDVLGPILFEGSHTLFRVLDKVMPSERDPEILRLAQASVLAQALAKETARRVQWQLDW